MICITYLRGYFPSPKRCRLSWNRGLKPPVQIHPCWVNLRQEIGLPTERGTCSSVTKFTHVPCMNWVTLQSATCTWAELIQSPKSKCATYLKRSTIFAAKIWYWWLLDLLSVRRRRRRQPHIKAINLQSSIRKWSLILEQTQQQRLWNCKAETLRATAQRIVHTCPLPCAHVINNF